MSPINYDEVFTHIKKFHSNEQYGDWITDIDTSCISVTLRSFQVDAVKWMLYKEKFRKSICVELMGKCVEIELPKGGILADEMGLGKTIEVLTCILNNPYIPESLPDKTEKGKSKIKVKNVHQNCEINSSKKKSITSTSQLDLEVREEDSCDSVTKAKKIKLSSVDSVIEDVVKMYGPKKTGLANPKYKMMLNWYETTLNGMSTSPRKKINYENTFRCFCSGTSDDMVTVCCTKCGTYQHRACVGLEDDEDESEGEDYSCPQCWTKREPIKSRATFIISPKSIANQWECEIKKHVNAKNFKVLVYNGVKGNTYIQPTHLAEYDIVITTYAVLCSELDYAMNDCDRKLRHAKRFYSVSSPLTCVHWWRICLDEAQMVEGYQSKTAVMAQVLNAEHRWAVTGTPIQKSIHDLFGLIQFLRIEHYDSQKSWMSFVQNKEEFLKFVGQILWRSCKKDVLHMLGVPEQKVIHHWLRFSPVEGYFYQRTHNECAYLFRLKLARFDDLTIKLKSLDRNVVNRLLIPLLKLRQACTHPQAVRGKFLRFKHTMTMDELLTAMVAKAKVDVEMSLRQYVSDLNGIAGLNIILYNWNEAVTYYRRVLHLNQEYKDLPTVKVDSLQMIHALHNLAEVLDSHSAGIPPTLRDGKLREDAEALEQAYIKRYEVAVLSVKEYLADLSSKISELCGGKTLGFSNWWVNVLNWVDDSEDLLHRIKVHLDDNEVPGQTCLSSKLSSIPSVHIELATWLANIDSARIETLEGLRHLELRAVSYLAEKALNCHLRQKKPKRSGKCQLCACEAVLLRYETLIFSINKANIFEDSDDEHKSTENDNRVIAKLKCTGLFNSKKEGSWKPSQTERVLQVLFSYAKLKKAPNEWLEDGTKHIKLLEIIRKEFKWLRACWSYISDQVAARDELSMAKMRLSLPLPEEEEEIKKKKSTDRHLILPHEVPDQLQKLESESVVIEDTLKKNIGILLYLQNLQKNDNAERDPCPVCREPLDEQWSVLNCGHCFCFVCIPTLLRMGASMNIECAVCRVKTAKADVSYVVSGKSKTENKNYNVKGSHSTKVEAVISELIKLRDEDPAVKVLIFSTWEKVLEVIAEALKLNEISFRKFGTDPKSKSGLSQFKTGPVTALLLPLRFGSNGLNLVEATHVFLVEPILNPADELQAVGRVHRIGQTRETFVHRFVIHNTIEERMLSSLESLGSSQWSSDNLSLIQLYDLFSVSNTAEDLTNENQVNISSS